MRSYLLLAAVASAFVAPQRALQRVTSLRAALEVSEQQSWMIDYIAKAHTARLEAVKRAKAEAAAATTKVGGREASTLTLAATATTTATTTSLALAAAATTTFSTTVTSSITMTLTCVTDRQTSVTPL